MVDMKYKRSLYALKTVLASMALVVLILANTASAQAVSAYSVQGYLTAILQFINAVLIPFLFSIALLFFLVNAARYFIIKGDDDGERAKARSLALYGIGAFVILVSFWGLINMFVYGLGFDDDRAICPDYIEMQNGCGSGVGDADFDDPGCYYVNGVRICG